MCAEYLHVCVCECAQMSFCETEALTPSSPLSHWLTAERLKAEKLFQTVELNDGRYSPISCSPQKHNTGQSSTALSSPSVNALHKAPLSLPSCSDCQSSLCNCPLNSTGLHTAFFFVLLVLFTSSRPQFVLEFLLNLALSLWFGLLPWVGEGATWL